ncbi:MAG: tRNA (adenosine(37)-N6)-threonylcarbamoyltransferase complex ATPase subunit type 1 TsaE [Mycobacteriales bacterium]|nr:tRNA (adenosine(37)-N6)-threonylcarbamoyltransferase complex ATPase subunit type 1 TsaE [Frankia sp.]
MRQFGTGIAAILRAGDLVVLDGPLGAGKTVLAQGIARGLDVTSPVTSPTFVIARVHRDGRLPFVHVDAYRLHGIAEIDDLDIDATLDEAVTVVEWGGGLVEHLRADWLDVRIARPVDGETRTVTLRGYGVSWQERAGALATAANGVDAPG